jgi:E3 ubiquitin-protein ligase HECTD2
MLLEALATFTPNDMRKFLAFTTGTGTVPIGGFKNLKLQVRFEIGPQGALPLGITCFNRLVLFNATSTTKIYSDLMISIHETEGFGLR